MDQITLYSFVTSPYAMKVHSYLLYKRLPFKVFYVNPIHAKKELPLGYQVPVLSINNESKAESSLIGHWLDEVFTDSPRLLSDDPKLQQEITKIDDWISQVMIPSVFYRIYPSLNRKIIHHCKNTLRLGYCVDATTMNKLPKGLRFFWPLLIRQSTFIKNIIMPLSRQNSADFFRESVLENLALLLSKNDYLAGTLTPSLADLSAWSLLVSPYKIGLDGFSDFFEYEQILSWVKRVGQHIDETALNAVPLVPANLLVRDI